MLSESDTLDSFLEQEDTSEDVEDKQLDTSFLDGICPNCLDSGFKHTTKNGVLGIAYRVEGQDSVGQPIKRLIVCNHDRKLSY